MLLWSDAAQGGSAYPPGTADGTPVTLEPAESGFVDTQTGSTWTVEGEALEGALTGTRLAPLERAYTAYWGGLGRLPSEHPTLGVRRIHQ